MADEGSNYPGFELQQRIFSHYGAALKQVSERMNEAWGKLSKGQYGWSDWLADLSRGAASQVQFLEELARLSSRDDHRPAWARLSWNRATMGVPSATVDLLRPVTGVLETSSLTPMGVGTGGGNLRLAITPVIDGNRLRIAVAEGTEKPASPCTYIGFVATQEARHTPEVIVLLDVRD